MKETKAQEFFNASITGVIRQGCPAMNELGDCMYLDSEGNRCSVGHLLSHAEFKRIDDPSMEISELASSGLLPQRLKPHLELLENLQEAHDSCSKCRPFVECFVEAAKQVATRHELKMPDMPEVE